MAWMIARCRECGRVEVLVWPIWRYCASCTVAYKHRKLEQRRVKVSGDRATLDAPVLEVNIMRKGESAITIARAPDSSP